MPLEARLGIIAANWAFYGAIREGDAAAMRDAWSRRESASESDDDLMMRRSSTSRPANAATFGAPLIVSRMRTSCSSSWYRESESVASRFEKTLTTSAPSSLPRALGSHLGRTRRSRSRRCASTPSQTEF